MELIANETTHNGGDRGPSVGGAGFWAFFKTTYAFTIYTTSFLIKISISVHNLIFSTSVRTQYKSACNMSFRHHAICSLRSVWFGMVLTVISALNEGRHIQTPGLSTLSPLSAAAKARMARYHGVHDGLRLTLTSMSIALCLKLPEKSGATDVYTSSYSPVSVFSPGYKIEVQQYKKILDQIYPNSKPTVLAAADDADSTIESLKHDAQSVLNEASRLFVASNKGQNHLSSMILMGHSRGGAVAALAAATLLNSTTGNERRDAVLSNIEHITVLPPKVLLVLLDPVDSSERVVLNSLRESITRSNSAWPWPVLVISTPFGGSSAYYKVPYESACAPATRNGDTFSEILTSYKPSSRITQDPSLRKASAHASGRKASHVLQVRMIDVGHTQLLANRKASTYGSVCAANSKIPDEVVQGFISTLTKEWIRISLSDLASAGKEPSTEFMELKRRTSTLFPAIRTEWSI
jgi:pimeloyl-ACP methyl ester carboxylesterase